MKDQIEIGAAVAGEEAVLAELAGVVQQLHVAERPDVFKPVNLVEVTEWFRGALLKPELRIVVARLSHLVVGYAVARDASREEDAFARPRRWRELDQLAVLPSHQRRGVARALVAAVAASASADGYPGVELSVGLQRDGAPHVSRPGICGTRGALRVQVPTRRERHPNTCCSGRDCAPPLNPFTSSASQRDENICKPRNAGVAVTLGGQARF
ncbi:MAG TPA: GNAT family N-acetyltransferase [Polyangia bacterium]|nr:GNAT family N-acetyltransferase [Polyangia bacterium]